MNIKKPEARKEHRGIWIANDPSCSMQPSGLVFKNSRIYLPPPTLL